MKEAGVAPPGVIPIQIPMSELRMDVYMTDEDAARIVAMSSGVRVDDEAR